MILLLTVWLLRVGLDVGVTQWLRLRALVRLVLSLVLMVMIELLMVNLLRLDSRRLNQVRIGMRLLLRWGDTRLLIRLRLRLRLLSLSLEIRLLLLLLLLKLCESLSALCEQRLATGGHGTIRDCKS